MHILLTGAAGGIGARLRRLLPPYYDLVLTDREPPSDLSPEETFLAADLADVAAIERAATGVDGILLDRRSAGFVDPHTHSWHERQKNELI